MPTNALITMGGKGFDLGAVHDSQRRRNVLANQDARQQEAFDIEKQQMQSAQSEAERKKRARIMAVDAKLIRDALGEGDTARADALFTSRLNALQAEGRDSSHTAQGYELFKSGNMQQLGASLDQIIAAAEAEGLYGSAGPGRQVFAPVPMYDDSGKFTGMSLPTYDKKSGMAAYTPLQGGKTVDPATLAGNKAYSAESGKLGAQLESKPTVEAEVTAAVEKVRRESEAVKEFDKQVRDTGNVDDLLDIAEPLLDEATESWGGVALDSAGRLVGLSSKGAQAAAKLKALQAALVLKMPRLEGPQSDRDQILYREAAAQIGDATVPAETRKAALGVIKQINAKYHVAKPKQGPASKYKMGDVITGPDGRRYRVTGGDMNDPDVEPM